MHYKHIVIKNMPYYSDIIKRSGVSPLPFICILCALIINISIKKNKPIPRFLVKDSARFAERINAKQCGE